MWLEPHRFDLAETLSRLIRAASKSETWFIHAGSHGVQSSAKE